MAEVTYTAVTWTAGDVITEAKMDNMVANDRAVDAMNNGINMTERSDPSTPTSNTLHLYAKDKSGVSTLYAINDAGTVYELSEGQPAFLFTLSGTLVTGTSLTPILPVHRALTITRVYAVCKTAPTGADLIMDINKNGTSIWNTTQANRIKIVASATSGSQTSFDTTTLTQDDSLTFDVDQVGSTVSGSDVSVYLRCK